MSKYLSISCNCRLLVFLLISGCECYPTQKGIILDEQTGLPIENARISFGLESFQTDEYGRFEAYCSQCHPKLIVSKFGYKPFKVKIESSSNQIRFEIDDNSTFVEYEKPIYLNADSTSSVIGDWKDHNSTHFEYGKDYDALKIYLTEAEKQLPPTPCSRQPGE